MSTTEADNKELVRRFVDDVFNEGNLDRIDEYMAEGYIEHSSAAPRPIEGRDAVREFYAGLRAAFPDLEVTIEELFAAGNKVVQRSLQSGTHEGTFMDIEPTGQTAEISGIVIYEIEDGRITESWAQADIFGLLQQLGVVGPPGE